MLSIGLSPLYDFAPMMVDPEWITRACRWASHEHGYPAWRTLARSVVSNSDCTRRLLAEMDRLMPLVVSLPSWLRDAGVTKLIVKRCQQRCRHVVEELGKQ